MNRLFMAKDANIVIKQNAQQLLIWLWSMKGEERLVRRECVIYLWPMMTASGRRSLVHYLEKQHYIETLTVGKQKYLRLSVFGVEWLERHCLGMSGKRRSWGGEWLLVAVVGKSEGDRGFRQLRSWLRQYGAVKVERGMYLLSAPMEEILSEKLRITYRSMVLVWELKKWLFGDERLLVFRKCELLEVLNLYSGISSDMEQVIKSKKLKKNANNGYISALFEIYQRLLVILGEDLGFLYFYFPNEANGAKILARLQSEVDLAWEK
jgi:hypothetical protein